MWKSPNMPPPSPRTSLSHILVQRLGNGMDLSNSALCVLKEVTWIEVFFSQISKCNPPQRWRDGKLNVDSYNRAVRVSPHARISAWQKSTWIKIFKKIENSSHSEKSSCSQIVAFLCDQVDQSLLLYGIYVYFVNVLLFKKTVSARNLDRPHVTS